MTSNTQTMAKTFGELSIEEKLELHQAMYERKPVQYWNHHFNMWATKNSHTFFDDYIYRIAPEPETDIELPWYVIQPEYQWAARDKNGMIYVYVSKPFINDECDWWYEDDSRNCGILIHKPGNKPWDQSLIKRPEGV